MTQPAKAKATVSPEIGEKVMAHSSAFRRKYQLIGVFVD
jgi:hypothetical protein